MSPTTTDGRRLRARALRRVARLLRGARGRYYLRYTDDPEADLRRGVSYHMVDPQLDPDDPEEERVVADGLRGVGIRYDRDSLVFDLAGMGEWWHPLPGLNGYELESESELEAVAEARSLLGRTDYGGSNDEWAVFEGRTVMSNEDVGGGEIFEPTGLVHVGRGRGAGAARLGRRREAMATTAGPPFFRRGRMPPHVLTVELPADFQALGKVGTGGMDPEGIAESLESAYLDGLKEGLAKLEKTMRNALKRLRREYGLDPARFDRRVDWGALDWQVRGGEVLAGRRDKVVYDVWMDAPHSVYEAVEKFEESVRRGWKRAFKGGEVKTARSMVCRAPQVGLRVERKENVQQEET